MKIYHFIHDILAIRFLDAHEMFSSKMSTDIRDII